VRCSVRLQDGAGARNLPAKAVTFGNSRGRQRSLGRLETQITWKQRYVTISQAVTLDKRNRTGL